MQPVALFPFKASWIIAPHVQKEILILYNIACLGENLSLTGKFETLLLNIHFSIWQKNFLFKTLWENIIYLNQAFFTSCSQYTMKLITYAIFWLYSLEYSRFIIISIQLVIPNISGYRFLIVDLLTVTLTKSSYSKASQSKGIKGNVLRGFSSGNISSLKGYHNVVLNPYQRPLSINVTTPATSSETLTIMELLTTSKYTCKRTIAA